MFDKIKAVLALFRQGKEITHKGAWKNGYVTVSVLGGFILTIANTADAFGHHLPIDIDVANKLASGIIAGAGVLLTIISSKSAGLPAKPADIVPFPTIAAGHIQIGSVPIAKYEEARAKSVIANAIAPTAVGGILNDDRLGYPSVVNLPAVLRWAGPSIISSNNPIVAPVPELAQAAPIVQPEPTPAHRPQDDTYFG